ncbi:NUDIX domain-containing protein [Egicoccus sp. AB-alg6-2]|uniref:NUDIX domain-containing protein n=1 Tax=Egicoccus sp. AB-alg6-2 TaxID=3242692 RepID=UPI00359D2934
MARSGHVAEIRALVGTHRLLLPSVGTAVFDRDRLLLVRHADGSHDWGLPGGAIEPGEHPADAAVREVHEETGLLVEVTAIAGVLGGPEAEIRYDNGDRTCYVTTVFTARLRSTAAIDLDRGELAEAGWFDAEALADVELPGHARAAVAAAVDVHHGGPPAFRRPTWQPG